jgi:hypothetical protein
MNVGEKKNAGIDSIRTTLLKPKNDNGSGQFLGKLGLCSEETDRLARRSLRH